MTLDFIPLSFWYSGIVLELSRVSNLDRMVWSCAGSTK